MRLRLVPAIGSILALAVCLGCASQVVHAQDGGVAEWANDHAGEQNVAPGAASPELDDSNASSRTPIERNDAARGEGGAGDARRQSLTWAWAPVALAFGLWWLVNRLRRGKPRDGNLLPEGVIASLGRRSVGGGHVVQLIRIGSRILVVTPTGEGLRTLTDITDPEEVERIVSLCLHPASGATGIAGLFGGRPIRTETETGRTARSQRPLESGEHAQTVHAGPHVRAVEASVERAR